MPEYRRSHQFSFISSASRTFSSGSRARKTATAASLRDISVEFCTLVAFQPVTRVCTDVATAVVRCAVVCLYPHSKFMQNGRNKTREFE